MRQSLETITSPSNRLEPDFRYGTTTSSRSALQELNAQTVKELRDWRENLPMELCLELENNEATYLPHVILLQSVALLRHPPSTTPDLADV